MKVLYTACLYNPINHNEGSGTDYDLYNALVAQGVEVEIVGPFRDTPSIIEKILTKGHNLLTRKRPVKYSNSFLRSSTKEVQNAVREFSPEIAFSFFAAPLVYLQTEVPIVYMLDTTLRGSHEQWPIFSGFAYRRMLAWERSVIAKSARIITCSQWSADILEKDYSVPKAKITVLPIPASLPAENVPAKLVFRRRELIPLNLLLVGRDFERKGIDVAIQVTNLLNAKGVPTRLRIVGLNGSDNEQVKYMGLYKKTEAAQLEDYIGNYQWAHFLIHPARFEAAGIVPGEAAAFGVPTLTNAAGGLATTVKDKVSGEVLPKDSPAEEYVKVIEHYSSNPEEYLQLCKTTRQRYEEELNWRIAGEKIIQVLNDIVRGS